MKNQLSPRSSLPLLLTACGLLVSSVSAEVKTFVIDSNQSSLTLSGSALGIALQQQAPGSLTTTYTGTIVADVNASTIEFVGGSAISANNNGTWQPGIGGIAGSAPANYGAFASSFLGSGYATLRNLLFDLQSEAIPTLGGSFAADTLEFSFPPTATSTADYRITGAFADEGSEALAGKSTNNVLTAATITVIGDELVLTIPVDYTLVITDVSGQFRVRGQFVARAANTTPLQIGQIEVTSGQLGFTIPTTPGKTYTILGSADLTTPLLNWEVIDQFEATDASTARTIALELAGQQFFILRED